MCGLGAVMLPSKAPTQIREQIGHDLRSLGIYLENRGGKGVGAAVISPFEVSALHLLGLPKEVFTLEHADRLAGTCGIVQTRYPTAGANSADNLQPFLADSPWGEIALAHNGNVEELKRGLDSDTKLILQLILTQDPNLSFDDALQAVLSKIDISFALLIMRRAKDGSQSIRAIQDPAGNKPFGIGFRDNDYGRTYYAASESYPIEMLGGTYLRDVFPGEMITLSPERIDFVQLLRPARKRSFCLGELVYQSRHKSEFMARSIQSIRVEMGRQLALQERSPIPNAIVVGVPNTGLDAARGFALQLGLEYRSGLQIINPARSFQEVTRKDQQALAKSKMSAIRERVEGEIIYLVDDSGIRGTVTHAIVQMLRDAGAKEIHMRYAADEFKDPCFYGMNFSERQQLIAVRHPDLNDRVRVLGVDSLDYLPLPNMIQATGMPRSHFCTACFTGEYPTQLGYQLNEQQKRNEHVLVT